jgi:hypothetical protein
VKGNEKGQGATIVKVIIPILITAIWTLATVRIEGAWPPAQAIQSAAAVSHQIEAPARSLLARISLEAQEEAPRDRLLRMRQFKDSLERQRRIALPNLPGSPRQPVCG